MRKNGENNFVKVARQKLERSNGHRAEIRRAREKPPYGVRKSSLSVRFDSSATPPTENSGKCRDCFATVLEAGTHKLVRKLARFPADQPSGPLHPLLPACPPSSPYPNGPPSIFDTIPRMIPLPSSRRNSSYQSLVTAGSLAWVTSQRLRARSTRSRARSLRRF